MCDSIPMGSCSPENSEPIRLGLDIDKVEAGVGALPDISSLSDTSSRLGDIQDRIFAPCWRAPPAFVA